MSKDEIDTICNNVSTVLTLWDGVLSGLHIEYPTKEECDKTQEFIDGALRMMRTMEINVTLKGHGGKIHIVPQMRSIKGGLFEFDESWTEL